MLEQAWFWSAVRIAAGAIVAIILLLGVVRPIMRTLAEKASMLPPPPPQMDANQLALEQQMAMPGGVPRLTQQSSYDTNVTTAKGMVQQDPRRVAQVVKQWVSEDGGGQ
jgi:flagellar M-ring protein FliF